LDTVNRLFRFTVVPAIADDAVYRRGRACIHRSMSGARYCREVVVVTVSHVEALLHHAAETSIAEPVVEPVEVFATHLVDDDADHKPGFFRSLLRLNRQHQHAEKHTESYPYHSCKFSTILTFRGSNAWKLDIDYAGCCSIGKMCRKVTGAKRKGAAIFNYSSLLLFPFSSLIVISRIQSDRILPAPGSVVAQHCL